jgi:hypothetical protein
VRVRRTPRPVLPVGETSGRLAPAIGRGGELMFAVDRRGPIGLPACDPGWRIGCGDACLPILVARRLRRFAPPVASPWRRAFPAARVPDVMRGAARREWPRRVAAGLLIWFPSAERARQDPEVAFPEVLFPFSVYRSRCAGPGRPTPGYPAPTLDVRAGRRGTPAAAACARPVPAVFVRAVAPKLRGPSRNMGSSRLSASPRGSFVHGFFRAQCAVLRATYQTRRRALSRPGRASTFGLPGNALRVHRDMAFAALIRPDGCGLVPKPRGPTCR